MNNAEYKTKFVEALFSRDIWTKSVSDVQYRTRCPYCGDSSDPNTGHLYLKIDTTSNFPIIYFCQKCPAGGVMDLETIERLEIHDTEILGGIQSLNKTSDKFDVKGIATDIKQKFFEYKIPPISYDPKITYVENRIGRRFTTAMAEECKMVTSLKKFLKFNNLNLSDYKKFIVDTLDKDYVGFLSYGNSHILFRDITNKHDISWFKFPITKETSSNKVLYTVSTSDIDIMDSDDIYINLSEGVVDIISITYNLGHYGGNNINMCVGGKYYEKVLLMFIDMGFVGSNIHVNIFSDNDKTFNNKKSNIDTTLGYYQKLFKYYKYFFGSLNIYYNLIYKDYGIDLPNIALKKHRL